MATKKKPLFSGFNVAPIEMPKTNAIGLPLPMGQTVTPSLPSLPKFRKPERVKISRRKPRRERAPSAPRLDTAPPPTPPTITPVPKPEPMRIQRQESHPTIAKQLGRNLDSYRSSVVANRKFRSTELLQTPAFEVSLPSTAQERKPSKTLFSSPEYWATTYPEASQAQMSAYLFALGVKDYPTIKTIMDEIKISGAISALDKYTIAEQLAKAGELIVPSVEDNTASKGYSFPDVEPVNQWIPAILSISESVGVTPNHIPEFLRVVSAIIMQESGGDADISNINSATRDDSHGLLQINIDGGQGEFLITQEGKSEEEARNLLKDPYYNLSVGLPPIIAAFNKAKSITKEDGSPLTGVEVLLFVLKNSGHPGTGLSAEASLSFTAWWNKLKEPSGAVNETSTSPVSYSWIKAPVTLGFRDTREPYSDTNPHRGIDWYMPGGTPLESILPGTVTIAGDNGGYGNMVEISYKIGEDEYKVRYAHLSEVAVAVGERVSAGQNIGASGNTGFVVGEGGGYHLHFEVTENGELINPLDLLNAGSVVTNRIQPTVMKDSITNIVSYLLNTGLKGPPPPETPWPTEPNAPVRDMHKLAGEYPGELSEAQFLLDVQTEDPNSPESQKKMEAYRALYPLVTPLSEEDIDRILHETIERPMSPEEKTSLKSMIVQFDGYIKDKAFDALDSYVREQIKEKYYTTNPTGPNHFLDVFGEISNVAEGLAAITGGPAMRSGVELRKKAGLPDWGVLNLLMASPALVGTALVPWVPIGMSAMGKGPYGLEWDNLPDGWEENKKRFTEENMGELLDVGPIHITPQTLMYELYHPENLIPMKFLAEPLQDAIQGVRNFGGRWLSGGRTAIWFQRQAGVESWNSMKTFIQTAFPGRSFDSISGAEVMKAIEGGVDNVPDEVLQKLRDVMLKGVRPGDKDLSIFGRIFGVPIPHYWHPIERAVIENEIDSILYTLAKKIDAAEVLSKKGGLADLKAVISAAKAETALRIAQVMSGSKLTSLTAKQYELALEHIDALLNTSMKNTFIDVGSGLALKNRPKALSFAADVMKEFRRNTERIWRESWDNHYSRIAKERSWYKKLLINVGFDHAVKPFWNNLIDPINVAGVRAILGYPGFLGGNVFEALTNNVIFNGKRGGTVGIVSDKTALGELTDLVRNLKFQELDDILPIGKVGSEITDPQSARWVAEQYAERLRRNSKYIEVVSLLDAAASPELGKFNSAWIATKRRFNNARAKNFKEALFPQAPKVPTEEGLLSQPEAGRANPYTKTGLRGGIETVAGGVEKVTGIEHIHRANDLIGKSLRARFLIGQYYKRLDSLAKARLLDSSALKNLLLREGLQYPTGLPRWARKELEKYIKTRIGREDAEEAFRHLDDFVSEGKVLKGKLGEYLTKDLRIPPKVRARFAEFSKTHENISRMELDQFLETELKPYMEAELLGFDLFLMPERVTEAQDMIRSWKSSAGTPKTANELLEYANQVGIYGEWIRELPHRVNSTATHYASIGDKAAAETLWTELAKNLEHVQGLAEAHAQLVYELSAALKAKGLHQRADMLMTYGKLSASIANTWKADRDALAALRVKYGPMAYRYKDEWTATRKAVWDEHEVVRALELDKEKQIFDAALNADQVITALKREATSKGKFLPTLRGIYLEAENRGALTPLATKESIDLNFPGLYDDIFPARSQMERVIQQNPDPVERASMLDELGKMFRGEKDISAYHAAENQLPGNRDFSTVSEGLLNKFAKKGNKDLPSVLVAPSYLNRLAEVGIEIKPVIKGSAQAEVLDIISKAENAAKGDYLVYLAPEQIDRLKALGIDVTGLPKYKAPAGGKPAAVTTTDLQQIRYRLASDEPLLPIGVKPTTYTPPSNKGLFAPRDEVWLNHFSAMEQARNALPPPEEGMTRVFRWEGPKVGDKPLDPGEYPLKAGGQWWAPDLDLPRISEREFGAYKSGNQTLGHGSYYYVDVPTNRIPEFEEAARQMSDKAGKGFIPGAEYIIPPELTMGRSSLQPLQPSHNVPPTPQAGPSLTERLTGQPPAPLEESERIGNLVVFKDRWGWKIQDPADPEGRLSGLSFTDKEEAVKKANLVEAAQSLTGTAKYLRENGFDELIQQMTAEGMSPRQIALTDRGRMWGGTRGRSTVEERTKSVKTLLDNPLPEAVEPPTGAIPEGALWP